MNRFIARVVSVLCFAVAVCGPAFSASIHLRAGDGQTWYKGVTHFHTLWSDGNCAPEVAVKWYLDHGYDFISISDHNVLATGERWMPVGSDPKARLTPERIDELQATFGEDWVELREVDGVTEMRLKNLQDLIDAFSEPGTYLLIPGEEVTAKNSVHINAINIAGTIEPAGGETTAETLRNNYDAIEAHVAQHGLNTLVHINHPNFSGAITAEEIIGIGGERFFEVYNGHPSVRNWGDVELNIVSTDRLWDIILSKRFADGDTDRPMYGVATDDAHNWYGNGIDGATPGRGWIMVLADSLKTGALIDAVKAGRFYATSGVTINSVDVTDRAYAVGIQPEDGVTYTTQFIGTPKGADLEGDPVVDDEGNPIRATHRYSDDVGSILYETTDNPAVYTITGDEVYVRAKIVSSKVKANPFVEGDREMAWTQPVRIP